MPCPHVVNELTCALHHKAVEVCAGTRQGRPTRAREVHEHHARRTHTHDVSEAGT